jgi:hypothetical protein
MPSDDAENDKTRLELRLHFHAGEIRKAQKGNSPSHLCVAFMGFRGKPCNPIACCSREREDIAMRNKGYDCSSFWNSVLQQGPRPISISGLYQSPALPISIPFLLIRDLRQSLAIRARTERRPLRHGGR